MTPENNQKVNDQVMDEFASVAEAHEAEQSLEQKAMEHFGKKLAELSTEEMQKLNEIIDKYRQKILQDHVQKARAALNVYKPKSFYTKKGPGKGKRQKRNRNR